ncbi:cobalt/nickel transport system ATP-binding protein [Methanofollis sp. W23]|uniref:ATP-binding cassette domain-containing protein n=1 Tax=Methanofollis sp. W23 TaxID=2817849 RepID=UPI001AE536C4|nr:ATP-binding cassette domain-containing protein [Methanofollis sp. W23]MBP2145837.1 cobalt/nickel transport system ATP-binding protein [Methanofollis sp. W23]
MHIIETRDLTYAYPNRPPALNGVNFTAGRKERVAVIGANGAGKSTLFKHLNGILKPSSGEALVHGEAVTKKNLREVRKTVGLVFQNPDDQVFSPTVEQDIAFGPTNLGLDEEMVTHRVESAIRLMALEDLRDRPPHHLSGGEKKRVAIAGVLAMEPQVLVLDEPTAGLDPQGVADLVRFVNTLPEEFGMTVIFSTHHLDLVPELADSVYVMDHGQVVAHGSVPEIFSRPALLEQTRLDVPALQRLMHDLRDAGVPIGEGYTYEEVVEAFTEAYRGRA